MEFNIAEKLAIVKDIDRLILADDTVARGEMAYMGQLMNLLGFDSEFVEEARKFNIRQAEAVLQNMSEAKKHSLAIILHEMAYADGVMEPEEIEILFGVFRKAGIKMAQPGNYPGFFDISDIYFRASRLRTTSKKKSIEENVQHNIKVEPHIQGDKGYTLSIFRSGSFLKFWGNSLVMTPKQMEIDSVNASVSRLKGYASTENMQKDHRRYRLNIFHPKQKIEKMILVDEHLQTEYEYTL